MKNNTGDQLLILNRLYKEMDTLYHLYAKKCGLSDTALWLLYCLYENQDLRTQRDICSEWHYPPQTINSSLKSLENQDIVNLEPIEGNKKNKYIALTDKGHSLIQETIRPLMDAEEAAFQKLENDEREAVITATSKYLDILHDELERKT